MTVQKEDIDMYQGDRSKYKFSLFTDDAKTIKYDVSAAVDVTMSVKQTLDANSVLFSKTITDGLDGSDFANGILIFLLTKSQTALLSRNGRYDVQVDFGSDPITVTYGEIVLQKQVTPT